MQLFSNHLVYVLNLKVASKNSVHLINPGILKGVLWYFVVLDKLMTQLKYNNIFIKLIFFSL